MLDTSKIYNKSSQHYEKREGIVICGCMGAVYGEPYCPCTMRDFGLPMSVEHVQANERFKRDVTEMFRNLSRNGK